MGICTSKPSPEPNLSDHHDAIPAKENLSPAKATPKPSDNAQKPTTDKPEAKKKKEEAEVGKKSPFFPFYSPSPAHFLFSKKSPARSPANASSNSTPKRFFRRPFPPPSPAKHIKAVWARRHGSVKPNEAAIPEGNEVDGSAGLDKSFGFSKHFENKYELGDEVGRGHFGYTCKAKFKKGELKGQEVAVKVIPKSKMTTAIAIEDVRREVKILRALTGHNNLVQFYDAYEDHDNVYVVMELCEGGELLDRILSRGGKYTEDDAKAVMIQILNVVAFCHLQGVVHRDLKPENFLFMSKDEDSQLKAIDFGLSDFVKPDERLNDIVGSAYYVAPEVLHRSYSTEADVWSIGVISYILLCGSRPFWARTESGIFRAVLKADPSFEEQPCSNSKLHFSASMAEDRSIVKTFPVKPKIKPTLNKTTPTPESKYWKSFKSPKETPTQTLISSITSISFSPTSPHHFAVTQSATVTIFSSESLTPKATISSFKDTATSASFRSDGRLLAAGSHSGLVQVFDAKSRLPLRKLRGHSRPVHVVKYPRVDKLHLLSGADDAVVKYWDVASETPIHNLVGHKDYVRSGDFSPASDDMFVTGSYDHTVRVWDVRVSKGSSVIDFNHGKPVEDVIYLPSGGLIATAGGNCVKIWDVIGGGKLLHSMESHNKTVTSICVGKIGRESAEEAQQYRILSVGLDGYMKVYDYAKFKVTHSMRFPAALLSIAFSPDCSTRVIGASNGVLYAGKRKMKEDTVAEMGNIVDMEVHRKRELRPSHFRYFHRGQNEKPSDGDFLIMRLKKVKLAEHDKLLKKFRHKEALISALKGKNPENVVAVMEELVARRKLLTCVTNLETEELGLLLGFLQRHTTMPRYAGLLMGLAKKVIEMRAEDIRASDELKGHIRNLKRSVEEEIRIQQSMQEIQGIISPLLRIAGR